MNMMVRRVIAVMGVAASLTLPLQTLAAPAAPGQGLEISPPVIDNITANPGDTLMLKINVRDVSSGPLNVTGKADDFGAQGELGEPHILLDEKDATRYSLKYWVTEVPSLSLQPQERRTLLIPVHIPANAEPGGHYGVIRFTGLPPDVDGTGVSLSASIGTLVLLKINGNITEKLNVQEMYASHGGLRGSFFQSGPIALTERIKNVGSVHEKPVGTVDVKNMFGKKIASLPLSNPAHNVLPDSVRRFDQKLDHKNLFGRYTASINATYASKKSLDGQVVFWVIPWSLILAILLILIVIFFIGRFSLRRYNQRIIAQARRR